MASDKQLSCLSILMIVMTFVMTVEGLAGGDEDDAWPSFRGQQRDGISHTENILTEWPDEGLNAEWKVAIGTGFSSLAAANGHLYTMFAEDSTEYVACFTLGEGLELWRTAVGEELYEEFGNGPRSTPAIDEERVYALGARGNLVAVHRITGEMIWESSFPELFGSALPRRGFAMSPLVDGNSLVIEAGGVAIRDEKNQKFRTNLIAFQKKSGYVIWQHSMPGNAGYSSPLVAEIDEVRQYIFATSGQVLGLSVTGELLWSRKALPGIIAMPVLLSPNRLFLSSSTDEGCKVFRLNAQADSMHTEDIWANRHLKNHFNSSLHYKGFLYGFNNATLTCLNAATGERQWSKRGYGKGSLIVVEGKLLILSDRGKLILADTDPEEFREISSFQALDGKSWTSPIVTNGRVVVRNQSEMACYDLKRVVN